ncbi:hypothetical protein ACFWYW_14530 [Nonomuraea sp. NPDC059023]|uniref:hypothetical protein n=1 Tax=unclassified Nonomuraea TaxID=2593643 RepID=UPI0036C58D94
MARAEIHIQLNVDFADDPKVRALARFGRDARRIRDLYVQMLCYAKRNLTDGHVPTEQLGILVFPDPSALGSKDVARLVEVGLVQAVADGWHIPGFLKRNKSRQQVQQDAQEKADKSARAATFGNHRRWHEQRLQLDPDTCVHCREAIARSDRWTIAASESVATRSDRPEAETEAETEAQAGLDSSPKNPPPPNPPAAASTPDAEPTAAERVGALVGELQRIRPEWQASTIQRVLADPKLSATPWSRVQRALLAVAADPATQGPGRVLHDGPWWTQQPATSTPSPRCGRCSPARRIEGDDGRDLGPCPTCHPASRR